MKTGVPFFWIATYGGLSIMGTAPTKEEAAAAVVGDFELDKSQAMLLSEIDATEANGWRIAIHTNVENDSGQQPVAA